MVSCIVNNKVEYITKLDDFRILVGDSIYEALVEFVGENSNRTKSLEKRVNMLEEILSDIDMIVHGAS